jgi:hypothetical protein
MVNEPVDVGRMVDELKHERDEIALQIHLARAELRDEWQELEHKWEQMRRKGNEVLDAMDDSADEVWAAVLLLRDELKAGYRRIKDRI